MLQKLCAFILYRMLGWRIAGQVPWQNPRLLFVFLPHTSNWDFVYGCLFIQAENIKITMFGKDGFYVFPFKFLYDLLGVVPIKRDQSNNFVEQAAQLYDDGAECWSAMAPEGTRGHIDKLKSGYYYLAKKANIEIVAVGPNFKHKTFTVIPPRPVFATFSEDSNQLIDFSKTMLGKRPEQTIQ